MNLYNNSEHINNFTYIFLNLGIENEIYWVIVDDKLELYWESKHE